MNAAKKNGFRVQRKLFMLVFPEDSDLHGLEITCRAATLGERRDYLVRYGLLLKEEQEDPLASLRFQGEYFLSFVTDWNLEDENGNELPKTFDSLETLPMEWITPIISAYVQRSLGQTVEGGLEKKSETGDDTETTPITEESLPMEPLQ